MLFRSELDHLRGKLYIDYLESLDELIPVTYEEGDSEEEGDGASEDGAARRRKRAAGAHSH